MRTVAGGSFTSGPESSDGRFAGCKISFQRPTTREFTLHEGLCVLWRDCGKNPHQPLISGYSVGQKRHEHKWRHPFTSRLLNLTIMNGALA